MDQEEDFEFYSPNTDSKKRKSENISKNPYETINNELKDLYVQRKKLRENESAINLEDEEKTKEDLILVENLKKKETIGKTSRKKEDSPNALVDMEKDIHPDDNRPVLWINKLKHYPRNETLPNMIAFREILFEDLLKNSNSFLQS